MVVTCYSMCVVYVRDKTGLLGQNKGIYFFLLLLVTDVNHCAPHTEVRSCVLSHQTVYV